MVAKRIAIMYSELAGYTLACLKELKQRYDVEILVFHWPASQDAPFDFGKLPGIDHAYSKDQFSFREMIDIVTRFDPHLIKISGWMDKDYLVIGKMFKNRGVPVIAGLDAPWTGSLKQVAFCKLAPPYLKRHINAFWVTGERQAQFARKFGYYGQNVHYGLYCCDWKRFASVYYMNSIQTENAFLFAGRYVTQKGIHNLIEAYREYLTSTEKPWKLYCAGTGELTDYIDSLPDVENVGFVQPADLPGLMQRCRAFVLPSLFEPWGVVIQEAAAAGLPVICSDACGASVHLVQDGYNGYVFEAGNTRHLLDCLVRMSSHTDEELSEMSEAGFELSKQFRPERWADTLMSMLTPVEKASQSALSSENVR